MVSAQSGVPAQDPSKVKVDPELESKFQDTERMRGLFSTQEVEREEVLVGLEDYKGRPTTIEEMKDQASKSQRPLLRMAENNPNVELKNKFWITNAVLLEAPTNFPLENIASVQGVERLDVNAEVKALQSENQELEVSPQASSITYGLNQINATETWNRFDTKGEGVKLSVIDTGIDVEHDDLDLFTTDESDPTYPGGWAEFDGGRVSGSTPYDCGSHGTHVSGTVSGGNASGTNIGVAPEVELMHAGALVQGSDCTGFSTDIIEGMEWSVENNADIISMSLGVEAKVESFIDAVRGAEASGVVVIGASGNNGTGTSISPSNVYNATAVGASDPNGDIVFFSSGEKIDTSEDWNSDNTSDWPSEYIVPDIAGPGVNVYSSIPGNSYGTKSGTSMATPHVSGAAALMQSATDERLSPQNISKAFVQTAWKPDDWDESSVESIDGQDIRYGHGIIDVYESTDYAVQKFDVGVRTGNITVNESEVGAGEYFNVSGDIKNVKDSSNQVKLVLKLNQSSIENKTVNLDPSESKAFEFQNKTDQEGYYNVYVNNSFAGGLNVDMPDPDFNLTAQLNESDIIEGESANTSGVVNNTGGDGIADLRLLRNGSEIDQKKLNISLDSSKPYNFVNVYNQPGYYNISVNGTFAGNLNVLDDAELNLSDFQLNSSNQFFENDTLEASVNASNTGDVTGLFNISLEVDGSYDRSKELNISAGSTENVSFSRVFEDRGNYTLSIGNLSETLEVLREGSINITGVNVSNTTAVEGDQLNYTAEFENPGDVQASDILEFQIDGSTEESRNVTVDKLSQNQTVFTRVYDNPGNYTLSVNSSQQRDIEILNNAELNITGISLSNSTIVEDKNISVNVSAQNIGDIEGSFLIPFNVTGESNYSLNRTESLEPGVQKEIGFEQTLEDPGNYTAETINYSTEFDVLKKPNISILNSSVNTTEIFQGQTLGINTTVENTGEVTGNDILNYSIGELEKLSDTGEVDPGMKNISETLTPLKNGNYSAKINSSNISDLEVKRPEVDIVNSSFNVSQKGLVKINTSLNNTDPGLVNETLKVSINESNFSETYSLGKEEERNVTGEVNWNETGFYILKLNGSEIGNFSLDPYAEFSDLRPDEASYTEGDEVEFSGNVSSVGAPNLTVSSGSSEFESNLSSGLDSFSFTESSGPGSYEWSAEASFNNSSFSSESLSYEVEEEDDSDGGGGSSGGGFSAGGAFTSEAELEVEESQDSISIKAPEGEHTVEFNETGLPIKSLSFTSDEEGTVNFSTIELDHNGSMETVFEAETGLNNSFNLTAEISREWIEENSFEDSQASIFRYNNGWNDLNPDVNGKSGSIQFNVETGFSSDILGLGVDQACYSMDSVEASINGSCKTYSNICEVPLEADVVESCETNETEKQIRREITEIRQQRGDIEAAERAEDALESGDFEKARNITSQFNLESQGQESFTLDRPKTIFVILILVSVIIFAGFAVLRPIYRKKVLYRRVYGLTDDIKQKAQRDEDIEKLADMLVKADQELIDGNYDEAERIIEDAENIT